MDRARLQRRVCLGLLCAACLSLPQLAAAQGSEQAAAASLPAATLELGLGTTQRTIGFGVNEGRRALDSGFVPAFHIALDARFGERAFLGVNMSYQTSVFAAVAQAAPDPQLTAASSTIQSHRISLGLMPGLRLGASRDSALVGLFVGYGLRAFASVIELNVPRYTWHGPVARLEFELPLIVRRLVLRLAPEAQLIVGQTSDLRLLARTNQVGFAFGGEASIRVFLTTWLAAAVSYREARAGIGSGFRTSFEDIERYIVFDAFMRYY